MKAVIVDHNATGHLSIGEVESPTPERAEAVVSVRAFSLNRGELRRAETGELGSQLGWDFAGIVDRAAADGSGPETGSRVVGFSTRMEAFAEQVAVPTHALAVLPDQVSFVEASTLPVAGLTALYALERCDRLLGSRVLVTGASGGVGIIACELGTLMGAHVIGQIRRADYESLVAKTGATPVVSSDGESLQEWAPFRSIIDGVGGPLLGRVLTMLTPDGRAIAYGVSDSRAAELPVRDLLFTGAGRIEGFHLYRESQIKFAGEGLARLLGLVEQGRLQPHISVTEDWSQIGACAENLIARRYPGKGVLTIGA